MAHNRRLVVGGVSLVKIRLRFTGTAIDVVRDQLEQVLVSCGFFEAAPFRWIGLILRYGTHDRFEPEYEKIDKKDGELPIAIELDAEPLKDADLDTTINVFRRACVTALLHVAKKFGLPMNQLQDSARGTAP